MKLLLARHGQTDWNLAGRFQGHGDIPLNELGLKQAKAMKLRLENETIDFIYSSDLCRAVETARIISEETIQVQTDSRLREVNFGDWEGLTYTEIQKKYPAELAAWEKDVFHNAPPGGETLEQLAGRAKVILTKLSTHQENRTILLVTHGGMIKVLICLALNLPVTMYWQFQVTTASLSEIEFFPLGAILNFLNNTNHLGDL